MPNSYIVGALVRVASYGGTIANPSGGYRDINGSLIDPSVVILTYRDGLGNRTVVTYPAAAIVKDSVGLYHADLDTTGKIGNWDYEWSSTGTGQAANKSSFQVLPGV